MISFTVVLFDCESESDHCFLKSVRKVFYFCLCQSPWRVHREKTKALTGNTSKGFQVEKRSAGRAARRLLAPVATPVGLGAN